MPIHIIQELVLVIVTGFLLILQLLVVISIGRWLFAIHANRYQYVKTLLMVRPSRYQYLKTPRQGLQVPNGTQMVPYW